MSSKSYKFSMVSMVSMVYIDNMKIVVHNNDMNYGFYGFYEK